MKKGIRYFAVIAAVFLLAGVTSLFADDSGFTSFADETAASPLTWSGSSLVNTRFMTDYDNPENSPALLYPELNIAVSYSGESSDFKGSFTFSGNYDFTDSSAVSSYLSGMIDEAYYRAFLNGFSLEAGLMKIVWGKGDEIFTFDNINAVDYSDFMNGSYLDRKQAEIMLKINIPFAEQGLIEALYTPVFTPDNFPASGYWVQSDYTTLKTQLAIISKTPEEALNPENTNTLKHGQTGLHITNSFGGIDFGAAYEYTFLRVPVVDMRAFLVDPAQQINVTYDRLHLFGIEAATAPLGFNLRAEAAYYLTGDTGGTDPMEHNNKIQYLIGFDRDLPLHNLSVNIQERGEVILKSGEIKANGLSDIEYETDGEYTSNIIAGDIRDTFLNGNLTVKFSGAYSAEDSGYMIKPGFDYTIADDAVVKAAYTMYRGDTDSLFGQFKNNDMLEVIFKYSF
ncbi:MAG: hypothetical protein DRP59_06505 [Spirochaetes bacterium]|nr:MAG: hypothetical protein DRP59_06505 [Spirochaetota bacterium]